MASPEILEFERLLAPVAEENPAGEDLRADAAYDSIYNKIATARDEASQTERTALRDGADGDLLRNDPKDWGPILDLAPEAISQRSKDLKVTAFLIESLVRAHGFAGLRDGFRLARRLVEDYWDDLYPRPDEDDDEDGIMTRVAPLTSLNGEDEPGTLIRPITKVPITQGRAYGPFSSLHYKMVCLSAQGQDASGQNDPVTKEMFDVAVRETSPEWFVNLADDLAQCSEEFESLCGALKEKCGDEDGFSLAPPSSNIRKTLQQCRDFVGEIAPELLPAEPAADADDPDQPVAASSGQIATRQEAFRLLKRTADFFRQTEPHSPVSYALEQAVRWGEMALPELLMELVEDGSAREQLFKLMGIKPPEEEP